MALISSLFKVMLHLHSGNMILIYSPLRLSVLIFCYIPFSLSLFSKKKKHYKYSYSPTFHLFLIPVYSEVTLFLK